MITKYPKQSELKEVFELRGNELWRKGYTDSIGRKYDEKLVENKSNCNGYCLVRLRGRKVLYHTIIWILNNGDINDSSLCIDHVDGNTINNDISNLRLVSNRENQQNTHSHRGGRLCGCYFNNHAGKWMSQIRINKMKINLGYFSTEQEAHEQYQKALDLIDQFVDSKQFQELLKKGKI